MDKAPKGKFYPLYSDPDHVNLYLNELGVTSDFGVVDVVSFQKNVIDFVPSPVFAIILMYPIYSDDKFDEHFSLLEESERDRTRKNLELSEGLFFVKQTIPNASGTVALTNMIANNLKNVQLKDGSILKNFIDSTKEDSAKVRGKALEGNPDFINTYEKCAKAGSVDLSFDDSPLHYVALIEHKHYLWRVDGRDKAPFRVNITNKNNILEMVAEYAKEFLRRNKSLQTFAALSLTRF